MNKIFVFGSNLAGRHGAGAAATAHAYHGAEYGIGEGHTGDSYAIPTKDASICTRSLEEIEKSVATFLQYAVAHPELQFYVTAVGCGLAGYGGKDIAPMFRGHSANCELPSVWDYWLYN